MTEKELDKLEALSKAATAGPWETGDPYDQRTPARLAVYGMGMEVADTQLTHDAAFIAASREAVPALIVEVRRLRAEVGAAYGHDYEKAREKAQVLLARVRALQEKP